MARAMNAKEFKEYLMRKRLEALRAEVHAEKKPPASEKLEVRIRRKAR
jgi:hypothetical protein